MEEALLSFLLWMNRIQDIRDVPAEVPAEWSADNAWKKGADGAISFQATSERLVERCHAEPDGFIRFPVVLYGAHEIWIDGVKRVQFGNPGMNPSNLVVSAPVLECRALTNARSLMWRAFAYSKYYAHVHEYPAFAAVQPSTRVFGETLYIGSTIGLIVLAIFSFSVLYRKESNKLMLALGFAMVLNAIYQLMLVAPGFDLLLPMRLAHRMGDTSLGLGFACVVYCFYLESLIPRSLFRAHLASTVMALPFWLLGTTGDTIQFGTSLPMPTVLLAFAFAAYNLARDFLRVPNLNSASIFLFSLIFVGTCANDIAIFTGSASGYTFMSVGLLPAFLILLLAVNERISATYRERDYLRTNLEKEVQRKTAELETAMRDLRATQAELVQSAKLASLGTLSAGIAHEINNSINYVNGSVPPLEKIIAKLETVSPRDYEVGRKLLGAVRDGTSLTMEIVKSLRSFTGLNQAKFKDVSLVEVVNTVLKILSSRLKENYQVHVDVPDHLTLYADTVAMNQILMNLVTNALDAMPGGGDLWIKGYQSGGATIVEVIDSGRGIPEGIRARIFDPFFTTKDVGKGTGLGLYIISTEIKKHHGEIECDSEEGRGTTFRLRFPVKEAA